MKSTLGKVKWEQPRHFDFFFKVTERINNVVKPNKKNFMKAEESLSTTGRSFNWCWNVRNPKAKYDIRGRRKPTIWADMNNNLLIPCQLINFTAFYPCVMFECFDEVLVKWRFMQCASWTRFAQSKHRIWESKTSLPIRDTIVFLPYPSGWSARKANGLRNLDVDCISFDSYWLCTIRNKTVNRLNNMQWFFCVWISPNGPSV